MSFDIPGKLEKIKIISLDGKSRQLKPNGGIIVMVNPSKYEENHRWHFIGDQAPGTTGAELKFVKELPKTFTLPLLFDATGVMEPTVLPFDISEEVESLASLIPFEVDVNAKRLISVDNQLKLFLAVTGKYDGEEHQVKRVLISWGPRAYVCHLQELNIRYTLFKPNGSALRAEGEAVFTVTEDTVKEIAKNMISSPDLSHQRIVKAGDNLLLLCEEIYGDASFNLEVARYNQLPSIRRILPGMVLQFPPIEK